MGLEDLAEDEVVSAGHCTEGGWIWWWRRVWGVCGRSAMKKEEEDLSMCKIGGGDGRRREVGTGRVRWPAMRL